MRETRARKTLDRLYREHAARVFTYVRSALGEAPAAEDATQEVFVRAYRALARIRYDRRGKDRAWLLAIARNVVRDHIARDSRRPASLDEFQAVSAERVTLEDRDLLACGLRKLRDVERDVVVMRHYLSMSFDEISDALELPGGTVRSHMCRALDKLAKLLKKELST